MYVVPPHRDGWIDYLSLQNDDVPKDERSRTVHATIERDGRFVLPPQKENFALLALTDAGHALVARRDVQGEATLRLQPWARISGTVTIGGKPAANLGLQSYDPAGVDPDRERASARSPVLRQDRRRGPLRVAPRHAGPSYACRVGAQWCESTHLARYPGNGRCRGGPFL